MLRIGEELRPASCAAEMMGLATMLGMMRRGCAIDGHAADWIARRVGIGVWLVRIMVLVIGPVCHHGVNPFDGATAASCCTHVVLKSEFSIIPRGLVCGDLTTAAPPRD